MVLSLIWLLYFLQGIPYGFQTKFLPVLLRSHSLSLSVISTTKLLSLPWILKPLWAPLVDRLGTKTSWVMFNLFGMALLYLLSSCISLNDMSLMVVVIGGLNIMASTQDIAVDSIIVDLLPSQKIGVGNIAQVVGYKSGSLVGGGILGWLSSSFSWQQLFFSLFLIYSASAVLIFTSVISKPTAAHSKRDDRQQRLREKHPKRPESSQEFLFTQTSGQVSHEALSEKLDTNSKTNAGKDRNLRKRKNGESFQGDRRIEKNDYTDGKDGVFKAYCSIYRNILSSPGTKWTIGYVFVYKLGEQGLIAILPMALMDQGLSTSQTALWSGIWCQTWSILGSLLGGMIISSVQWSSLCSTLTTLSVARLLATVPVTWICSFNDLASNWSLIVSLGGVLHFVAGAITTVTFTLMVTCSKQCYADLSATHYSTLATFEVLGKLIMTSISGSLTETAGYNGFFLVCVLLLLIPIFLLKISPNVVNTRNEV